MRRGIAAIAVIVAAVATASGCGSSADEGEGDRVATAPAAAITIQSPADGARLKARATASGALRAPVRVRGRARPGSAVFISASCRPSPCEAQAGAADDGTWAVTLRLRTPRANAFVTIDANARRDVVAAGSAVATVELVGPPRPRPPRAPRGSGSGSGGRPAAIPPPSRRTLPRDVLVIGDSLALGIEQPLRTALQGWSVRVDGRIGRPLAEGMGILGRQTSPPAILALPLFTNDDPRNTGALEAAVRATATRPGGCAIWATVVAPPLNGVSYDAANTLLRSLGNDPELALGLQVVDWAAEVAQSPSLLAGDNVHPTPAGYGVMAQLYAAAIRSCAGRD